MPEILLGDRSFSINALRAKGPASLSEIGFHNAEIGKNSEALFERGAEVVRFINKVANDREYRQPTTQFFWTATSEGAETFFIKTPLGDSEANNKSVLLMFGANKELREQIQTEFTHKPTRESIKALIKALLEASGSHVNSEDIFVTTIAYMDTPANNLILQATRRLTTPFNVMVGLQHAGDIDVRHLPHQTISSAKPEPLSPQTVTESTINETTHQSPPIRAEQSQRYMDKQQVQKVETEDEEKLAQIDSRVFDRRIGGKFRGQVIIHGSQLTKPDYNLDGGKDYEMHPFEGHIETAYRYINTFDPTQRVIAFMEACYQDAHRDRTGLNDSPYRKTPPGLNFGNSLNFIFIQDEKDKEITHLVINAPNADYDYVHRSTYYCQMLCQLPTSEFEHLRTLIKQNPANAERFLQIAFTGIDESTWRIPVDRVSLIDIDQYIPMSILGGPKITKNLDFAMGEFARKKLLDLSAVETFHYDKPLPELKK